MHYMKWTRVMLPEVSEEFELACILLLFFSFYYHCQLVKGQLYQKSRGTAALPVVPVSTGMFIHLILTNLPKYYQTLT